MICKECATAGDIIALMHNHEEEVIGENNFLARDCVSVARFLHGLCKGCDCQHSVRTLPITTRPTVGGSQNKLGPPDTNGLLEPLY